MPERFLVTGATGFVGSAAARLLAAEGEVCGLARRAPQAPLPGVEYRLCDLAQGIPESLALPEACVIHCAASMQSDDRDQLWSANVVATRNVLEWCVRNQAKQLVLLSSGSVYGYQKGRYMRETDALNPIGFYGHSKHIAEQLCLTYQALFGLKVSLLRLYFPFGPGQDRGIFRFIAEAIRNGRPLSIKRDGAPRMTPTHIADVVAAIRCCLAAQAPGGVFNLCGSEALGFLDAVRRIEAIVGRGAELNFTEIDEGDLLGDNTRLREDLGWEPRFGLSDLATCIS